MYVIVSCMYEDVVAQICMKNVTKLSDKVITYFTLCSPVRNRMHNLLAGEVLHLSESLLVLTLLQYNAAAVQTVILLVDFRLYTVFHKIGIPFYCYCYFSQCRPILMKLYLCISQIICLW